MESIHTITKRRELLNATQHLLLSLLCVQILEVLQNFQGQFYTFLCIDAIFYGIFHGTEYSIRLIKQQYAKFSPRLARCKDEISVKFHFPRESMHRHVFPLGDSSETWISSVSDVVEKQTLN